MRWVYGGEPIGTDPETFYFMRVSDGGTTAEYMEWLEAAIKSRRLTAEREREISGSPAPIRARERIAR